MRIQIFILVGSLLLSVPAYGQLSDAQQKEFVAQLHGSLPLSDAVARVRDGKIPDSTIQAISTILSHTDEVKIHQMRGATGNRVFVSKDGKREAVYDAHGNLVRDGINDGSYNYFPAQPDPVRHLTFDIAPWLLLGQSPRDPTTREERAHAYAADVFAGLARVREKNGQRMPAVDLDLTQAGTAEGIVLFLTAIENGGADEMLEAVDPTKRHTDEELLAIVKRFESGLQKLLSSKSAGRATPPPGP